MDHPSIAKFLDAGTTEVGRPFFVMELVDGIAITEYCDRNRLTLSERLELFELVCQAIQHAHQKGIIHRDIKPRNVLVTLKDGKPTPKVIDFGVAKAIDQRLTERTLFTRLGNGGRHVRVHEPGAGRDGLADVDTRSDIYSLGVLLYELVTGKHAARADGSAARRSARSCGSFERKSRSSRAGGSRLPEAGRGGRYPKYRAPASFAMCAATSTGS